MGLLDRITFNLVVPRAARGADHVIAVSERTKADVLAHYEVPADKVSAIPHGVDPAFSPGPGRHDYVLFVGAVSTRKNPLAAADAADAVGLPLVVAGPENDATLARTLRDRGADLRGYVSKDELIELYRGAAALVLPSQHEGFGLPALEAMACGTPVVVSEDPALREVVGDARAADVRDAVENRERLAAAGIARARRFTWEETALRTAAVYRAVIAA
jgi:glycosyltransferase involved in cell wall biosynthesis